MGFAGRQLRLILAMMLPDRRTAPSEKPLIEAVAGRRRRWRLAERTQRGGRNSVPSSPSNIIDQNP